LALFKFKHDLWVIGGAATAATAAKIFSGAQKQPVSKLRHLRDWSKNWSSDYQKGFKLV